MRGVRCLTPSAGGRAYHAVYGQSLRSHRELEVRFAAPSSAAQQCRDGAEFVARAEPLLDRLEDRLLSWRRQRWDQRTPVLLAPAERQAVLRQLDVVRAEYGRRLECRRQGAHDAATVARLTGSPAGDARLQTKAWLQEEVSRLRWGGDVAAARELREAWGRLAAAGGPHAELLERLCCAYSLGRIGTFDAAFRNTICPGDGGGAAFIDCSDPFAELMALTLANLPSLPILHDFLGFNVAAAGGEGGGYRTALGAYMYKSLAQQLPPAASGAAAAGPSGEPCATFHGDGPRGKVCLFAPRHQGGAPADFVVVHGPDVTLVSVASPNKFLRAAQLPAARHMQGICRRLGLVLGVAVDSVRCRSLLLPPGFMDAAGLGRLHRVLDVAGTDAALDRVCPADCVGWARHYSKELTADDADYAAQAKKHPEEEWVMV